MLPTVRRRRVIVTSDSEAESSGIGPQVTEGGPAPAPHAPPAPLSHEAEKSGNVPQSAERLSALTPYAQHLPTPQHDQRTVTSSCVLIDVSSDSGSSDSNDPVSRKARKLALRSHRRATPVAEYNGAVCTPMQHAANMDIAHTSILPKSHSHHSRSHRLPIMWMWS